MIFNFPRDVKKGKKTLSLLLHKEPELAHFYANNLHTERLTNMEYTHTEPDNSGQKELCARMPGQSGA